MGDNSIDGDVITSNERVLELKVHLKELRMELERREAETKDLQMNKKSLVQEVSKLKSLLDVAAASTTSSSSVNVGDNRNDEEEDDLDVSFIREEVATQK